MTSIAFALSVAAAAALPLLSAPVAACSVLDACTDGITSYASALAAAAQHACYLQAGASCPAPDASPAIGQQCPNGIRIQNPFVPPSPAFDEVENANYALQQTCAFVHGEAGWACPVGEVGVVPFCTMDPTPQCANGVDDDGDGRVDYFPAGQHPADPRPGNEGKQLGDAGCTSPFGGVET